MRNTVVRAMIKVNGKYPILGTLVHKPFDWSTWNVTDDYVGGMTSHAKIGEKSTPQGRPDIGLKYHVQCFFTFLPFLYFLLISRQVPENTFLIVSPPFFCIKRRI